VTVIATLAVLAVLLWPVPDPPARGSGSGPGRVPSVRRVRACLRARVPWRRPATDDAWVADLADVVVVGLDAGLDLPRAVDVAVRSPAVALRAPELPAGLRDALSAGRPPGASLAGAAGSDARAPWGERAGDLGLLARSWRLSEEAGAAASATTAAAASSIRARSVERQRSVTLAAGPRASMWLLTALPLLGPLVGLLLGVGPSRLYGSAPARVGALVGVLLTAAGWAWANRLLRSAARPATTSGVVQ
jgi:tight adherence protein B